MPVTNTKLKPWQRDGDNAKIWMLQAWKSKLAETEDLQCEIRDSLASQVEEIQFGCSLGSTLAKVHAK